MTWSSVSRISAILVAAAGCTAGGPTRLDTGLDGLALDALNPTVVVPGSVLHLDGASFVGAAFGASRLRLQGTFSGVSVDASIPARFVDFGRLEVPVDAAFLRFFPAADGRFEGTATVEVDSAIDYATHVSDPLPVELEIHDELVPRLDALDASAVIRVNHPIELTGDGLLLGGAEGRTVAVVEGCFIPQAGGACAPVARAEVPVAAAGGTDRTRGSFAFAPAIAGIRPGTFRAQVRLRNLPAGRESAARAAEYVLLRPSVESVGASASLGQFLDVRGGGFVGGQPGQQTTLALRGSLARRGGATVPIDLIVVPRFDSGPLVRYVVNEEDALGAAIDLRRETGTFTGTITPVISAGADTVTGDSTPVSFRIAPVKQVVWVRFLPSYVESLRHFGLRAVDARIRARVLEVARRDYATVNVEFREEEPRDFALYSQVDISGPDPNGQGLLGYDNTPGKDRNNRRLFDRIGGVNATTQEDNAAGYGGVFLDSLFAFSLHPIPGVRKIDGADAAFDAIFDEFRADVGQPLTADDFAAGPIPALTSSDGCPAADRRRAAACAIWVLGSLIGTTTTHEIGHSLGLANPDSDGFHNFGDEPERLMDAGGNRPFKERAELDGEGPARFCDEEYDYLRRILPSDLPADTSPRPRC
jgi:hypothetical protein